VDVVESAVVMTGASAEGVPGSLQPVIGLRHRLEFWVVRAACALARRVPLRLVTATGAGLLGLFGPMLRQNRRALANLEIAFPEKTDAERRRIARAMWANMGRIFAETLVLDRIIAEPDRFEIEHRAEWELRMGAPGPAIGCTLHMGNWELAIWPLTLFGRAPVGVYKPLENPLLDRWLAETRRALYPSGLLGKGESEDDPRAGQRTARALIDIARKGGAIGFVSDHFDRRGEPIAFMGRQARFTTAPAMIARHVGARVWVGRCRRVGKESRFIIELKDFPVQRTGDKTADARALTTAIFAQFETWIRETPDQWMWWNTRWVKPDAAPETERTTASGVNVAPAPGTAA
jgi:KDO2-lipid IV(A) lauroyltransferase